MPGQAAQGRCSVDATREATPDTPGYAPSPPLKAAWRRTEHPRYPEADLRRPSWPEGPACMGRLPAGFRTNRSAQIAPAIRREVCPTTRKTGNRHSANVEKDPVPRPSLGPPATKRREAETAGRSPRCRRLRSPARRAKAPGACRQLRQRSQFRSRLANRALRRRSPVLPVDRNMRIDLSCLFILCIFIIRIFLRDIKHSISGYAGRRFTPEIFLRRTYCRCLL